MEKRICVSTVIPVYNVEKYLRACLDSALAQTLKDIEIICVDDGSTDGCPGILDEYAARDSRVRVIHKPNAGYGQAVNTGMDVARGEYFAILESDDIIHQTMYEKLYTLAKEHDLDVVKADYERFITDPSGEIVPVYTKLSNWPEMYGRVIEDSPAEVLYRVGLYTWSGLYKMDFLRGKGIRHNETPGASYQDNGFWFQTMSTAKRVYFVPEAFYRLRRDNPDSSIKNTGKVFCIRDEYDFIREFLTARPEVYQRVKNVYWWARFVSYRHTYFRVAEEYKMTFAQHFHQVMVEAIGQEAFETTYFSRSERKDLALVVGGAEAFHRKNRRKAVRNTMNPSRWQRIAWCVEDNGLVFALRLAVNKALKLAK